MRKNMVRVFVTLGLLLFACSSNFTGNVKAAYMKNGVSDDYYNSDEIGTFERFNSTDEEQNPELNIISPQYGMIFTQGTSILFEATALDPQDGDISNQVSWYSTVDGLVGTGASLTRSDLSEGFHELIVSITDSDAHTIYRYGEIFITTDAMYSTHSYIFADTSEDNRDTFTGDMVEVNGKLYFISKNESDNSLWVTDGTDVGTNLIVTIQGMKNLHAIDSTVYFIASDEVNGKALWRSDGTFAGTELVSILNLYDLTTAGDRLYFTVLTDDIEIYELWTSDGTSEGTHEVKDIFPGSEYSYFKQFTTMDGVLYFVGIGEVGNQGQLWRSDGTESGTWLIKKISNGIGGISYLSNMDGNLYFYYSGDEGIQVWKSDGTMEGTVMLKEYSSDYTINFLNDSYEFQYMDGEVFFLIYDDLAHQIEIWKTNGTIEGTELVREFGGGVEITNLISFNHAIYFFHNMTELWKTDGTNSGTVLVDTIGEFYWDYGFDLLDITIHDDFMYFITYAARFTDQNMVEIRHWVSNGLPGGTMKIHDHVVYYPSNRDFSSLIYNDLLIYSGSDHIHGQNLWAYDLPADSSPEVDILTPSNNADFLVGERVNFSGHALDIESGDLTNNIIWHSDLDGELGMGESISISDLTIGKHSIIASVTDSIGKKQSTRISLIIHGDTFLDTFNGSAEITSDQPIVAIGRPHMGAEIMGYNGINSGATTLYLPMLFNNLWNYTSTFTVENTTSSTATYTLTFKDGGNGTTSCVMSGETLPGHGVRTYDVTNLGACDSGYLPDLWAGGAKIESDQPLVAIATPKVDGVDPVTYNAFTGGADTVYLPMLFRNVWGYTSAFYVQNLDSTQNASISIDFYDGLGHFTCRYEDSSPIGPAVTRGYWVPSMSCNDGNSFPAEGWAGSAVIETGGSGSQEIVAIGRPHMGTEVAAYNGFTAGGTSNYLPMLFRNMWGYTSAVYIQNVSGGTITEPIEIVFYDAEGNYTCTYRDNEDLADKATRGYWIPSVNCNAGGSFPGDGWVGSATIHTSGEAIAVGRPHLSDGEVVAYGAFTGGETEAYVPMLFRKYNGNEAALYIQNLGDSDATVTITYYDEESGYYCAMAQEISPLSTGGVWLAGLDDSVCVP